MSIQRTDKELATEAAQAALSFLRQADREPELRQTLEETLQTLYSVQTDIVSFRAVYDILNAARQACRGIIVEGKGRLLNNATYTLLTEACEKFKPRTVYADSTGAERGTGLEEETLDPDNDRARGLYPKWHVTRIGDEEEKHKDCTKLVLDFEHDAFSIPAALAYASAALQHGYIPLARDVEMLAEKASPESAREWRLRELARSSKGSTPAAPEEQAPEPPPGTADGITLPPSAFPALVAAFRALTETPPTATGKLHLQEQAAAQVASVLHEIGFTPTDYVGVFDAPALPPDSRRRVDAFIAEAWRGTVPEVNGDGVRPAFESVFAALRYGITPEQAPDKTQKLQLIRDYTNALELEVSRLTRNVSPYSTGIHNALVGARDGLKMGLAFIAGGHKKITTPDFMKTALGHVEAQLRIEEYGTAKKPEELAPEVKPLVDAKLREMFTDGIYGAGYSKTPVDISELRKLPEERISALFGLPVVFLSTGGTEVPEEVKKEIADRLEEGLEKLGSAGSPPPDIRHNVPGGVVYQSGETIYVIDPFGSLPEGFPEPQGGMYKAAQDAYQALKMGVEQRATRYCPDFVGNSPLFNTGASLLDELFRGLTIPLDTGKVNIAGLQSRDDGMRARFTELRRIIEEYDLRLGDAIRDSLRATKRAGDVIKENNALREKTAPLGKVYAAMVNAYIRAEHALYLWHSGRTHGDTKELTRALMAISNFMQETYPGDLPRIAAKEGSARDKLREVAYKEAKTALRMALAYFGQFPGFPHPHFANVEKSVAGDLERYKSTALLRLRATLVNAWEQVVNILPHSEDKPAVREQLDRAITSIDAWERELGAEGQDLPDMMSGGTQSPDFKPYYAKTAKGQDALRLLNEVYAAIWDASAAKAPYEPMQKLLAVRETVIALEHTDAHVKELTEGLAEETLKGAEGRKAAYYLAEALRAILATAYIMGGVSPERALEMIETVAVAGVEAADSWEEGGDVPELYTPGLTRARAED